MRRTATTSKALRRGRRPVAVGAVVLMVLSGLVAATAVTAVVAPRTAQASTPSAVDGATRGADNDRTSWYPDQTTLTPSLVSGGTFGQLFKTAINGQAYGQPLLDDGQVLVNTENDYAYGVNPVTGAILWSRNFGTPTLASQIGGVGCADLTPNIGITGSPVVDQSTDTEYLVDNQYISGTSGPQAYYMQALELDNNGAEAPGFPVQIQGAAQNNAGNVFNPEFQLQRPGLLLMNGVVYAGFGSHCDVYPWQGWIAGVTESGTLQTMYTTMGAGSSTTGAGIWQAGGGLVSDGSGTILFATGNIGGPGNGPVAGNTPPADLGESVVRVNVQANGTLKPVDFFSPTDNVALDGDDLDFGSGAPVALPNAYFGTTTYPHLAVAVGKEGYVYLLNRDNLGGVAEGANGSDNVVGRFGPNGGVWSSPAVWPGNGGWIYVPTASGSVSAGGSSGNMDAYQYGLTGSGVPTLSMAGQSSDAFGYGSGGAVVTSNGTTSGSAIMWCIWSPGAGETGAQLRAYNPVPVNGALQEIWSAPIGIQSKFNDPGVGNDRIYVGTNDGYIEGFGAPVGAPITAPSPTFPSTIVGQSSKQTVTMTATAPVTVSSLTATGPFTAGTPSATLPDTLATGGTLSVPVTFTPTAAGPAGGGLTIGTTASGSSQVTLTGLGEVNGPSLVATTAGITFGGIPPGNQSSNSVGFANDGSQPVTISTVDLPTAPFGATGTPAAGAVIQPGAEVVVNVTFTPTANGTYASTLELDSNGGDVVVNISGNSTVPSLLQITPLANNFGNVPIGQTVTKTFSVTNDGGSSLEISKSKPPALGPFTATTSLAEGTTIAAGASLTESVTFTPTAVGTTSDGWVITADDGQGVRTVTFTGNGVVGDPASAGGWQLNGSSKVVSGALQLTQASPGYQAGTAIMGAPVSSANLSATFTATIGGGGTTGADGLTFMLANPSTAPTAVGAIGGGLGFSGLSGTAVALDTYKNTNNPSNNFVGVTNGPTTASVPDELNWLATSTAVPALRATNTIGVTLVNGTLTVTVNGTKVITTTVTVGPNVLLGFSAGDGSYTDAHAVSNVAITAAPPVTALAGPAGGGWDVNGSAKVASGSTQLTQTTPAYQAGTAFWPTPLSSSNLNATFTATIGGGGTSGADGMALVLADPSTAPTAVGALGGGLGFSGISGTAVALDTYKNTNNPSNNFVGVTNGPTTASVPDELHWLATSTAVPSLRATNTIGVTLVNGTLTVSVDGTKVITTNVTVGPNVLLGFSGGTGSFTDTHTVSNVSITAAPPTITTVGDPATAGGWALDGSSEIAGGALQLTQATPGYQAGTAFWPTPVNASEINATFTASIGGGNGADGLTFMLANATDPTTSVGALGGGLGFSGIPGVAVALDTYLNANNPSNNFVGVTYGPTTPSMPDELDWLTTNTEVPALRTINTITVSLLEGVLTVAVDGTQVLSTAVTVGPTVLLGFSAGDGALTDDHAVSNVSITST